MLPLQERVRTVVARCESQLFCQVIVEEARIKFRVKVEASRGGRFWRLTDPETYFVPSRAARFPGIFLTSGFDNANPYNVAGIGFALPSASAALLAKGPITNTFSPTIDLIDEMHAPHAFHPLFGLAAFDATRAALMAINPRTKGVETQAAIASLDALTSRIFGAPNPPPPSLPRGTESIAVFTMRARPKGRPPSILSAIAPKGDWFLEHIAAEANACQTSPIVRFASDTVGLSMAYHQGWEVDDAYKLTDGESIPHTVWVQADRGEKRENFALHGFGIALKDRVNSEYLRRHHITLRNHFPGTASKAVPAHELVDSLAGLVTRFDDASKLIADPLQFVEHRPLRKVLDDVVKALMRGMAHKQAGPKAVLPASMPSLHLIVPRPADP